MGSLNTSRLGMSTANPWSILRDGVFWSRGTLTSEIDLRSFSLVVMGSFCTVLTSNAREQLISIAIIYSSLAPVSTLCKNFRSTVYCSFVRRSTVYCSFVRRSTVHCSFVRRSIVRFPLNISYNHFSWNYELWTYSTYYHDNTLKQYILP